MIIQCPNCLAKFKMDDSKIKDGGTKVRCSKCKEVFVVTREESAPVAAPSKSEVTSEKQDVDFSFNAPGEEKQEASFEFGGFGEEAPRQDEGESASFSVGDEKEESAAAFAGFEAPTKVEGESGDFSFGGGTGEVTETKTEEDAGGVDWGGMAYGEVSFSDQAEEKPAENDSPVGFEFNEEPSSTGFEGESTMIAAPSQDEGYRGDATLIAAPPVEEQPIFSEEPSKSILFEEGPALGFEAEGFEDEFKAEAKKEKRQSLVNIFVAIIVVSAIAAGGLWYFWNSGKTAESGELTLAEMNGYYTQNTEAGNIFVIEGKVINNTNKPRSFFQVAGTLFNKDGKKLAQKNAYCGNMYSPKEINTSPRTKLENDMKNKYGPSLSNVNVAPGKFVGFTMVFFDLPADMSEFSVEVAGSEIASE